MSIGIAKRIVCLCLCLALPLCAADGALCEEKVLTSQVDIYSLITKDDISWQFEYCDSWFEADADEYSHAIARASLGMALSAFRADSGPTDGNAVKWMTELGFGDFSSEDYDRETSIDTISTVIGHKQLPSGETLLAVTICGRGYKNEWLSNLDIGDQREHRGFSTAAQKVVQRVESYMHEHGLSDPRLWLSGFSRSAAVANLAGASLMEKGLFTEKDAFIYTFATPNSTRDPVAYANIFNIVGKFDPIARIPYQEWGFERNGSTLYTPAQETDSDYRQKLQAADVQFYDLTGVHMWNDPVMNQHLAVLEAYLLSNIPTTADYDFYMKEPIAAAYKKTSLGALSSVLNAMKSIPAKDHASGAARSIMVSELLDYAFSSAFGVLDADETFVELAKSGRLAPALLLEHMPEIYLAWMFSSEDPEMIFTDSTQYMHLVVNGEADVSLFDQKGGFIMSMDPDGVTSDSTDEERYQRNICPIHDRPLILTVNADEKNIMVLPKDQGFPITMIARSDCDFQYYGIHYDIRQSAPTISSFRLLHMEEGEEYLAFLLTPLGQAIMNADEPLWGDAHEINHKFDASQLLSVSDAYTLGGLNPLHFTVRGTIRTLIILSVILLIIAIALLVGAIRISLRLLRRLRSNAMLRD